ncbi:tyrosine-type recombinase/integrase [Rhizobium sp. PL01]|uniref:tyrosine-type recombinase/integrase n=1 Tax=Rhizobium sp. PL01 TaxID=3085631 RepID=UPI0029817141|nr:tyrosine-type recombinase/integrase [Rhizobium sp. PL01]MDW5315501.1 tyrosine-type recombinase/integrase [Rhizobium sp. PL01]
MVSANKVKITDAVVKRATLPPDQGEMILWDTEVTGFGLRLRGSAKTYIVCYRPAGAGRSANTKKHTLGGHDVIKPSSEARKLALAVLGKVAAGGDPVAERAEKKRAQKARVSDLLNDYEDDLKRRKYVATDIVMSVLRRRLKTHASKDIRELKGADYVAIISKIEKDGKAGGADAFRTRCRTFLGWCKFTKKVLDANPLEGYRKGRSTREEKVAKEQHGRALSDKELVAVWNAADPDTVFGRLVRFLILTGCRRNEGAGLTRAMLKRYSSRVDLPASFTKQARGHTVFIWSALEEILEKCAIDARSDLVFPSSRTGKKMSGWSKMLAALAKKCGVKFTFHDLRRTFRTGLSRLDVNKDLAELALGHAREELEATYNRDDAEEKLRQVFKLWADHVNGLVAKAELEAKLQGAFA